MAGNFDIYPLGTVAKIRSGFAFKSEDMGAVGLPVIKIKNVLPPTVDITDCERVPEEVILKIPRVERFELKEGDTLIAMTGATVGKVGKFPRTHGRYFLNQRVGKVYLTDPDAADYPYIYYILSQDAYVRQMFGIADGSAQANISGSQIEGLEIPLPPLPIQRRIAHILGTLDDKIELNRRMNATLEEMARAMFKSWFVDFDPVHENMRRRQAGTQQHPTSPFEPTAQAVGLDSTSRSGGGFEGNPPTGVGGLKTSGSKTGGSNTGGSQSAKPNDGPDPNVEPTAQAVGLDSTSRSGGGFEGNPLTGVGGSTFSTFGFSVPPDIAALFPDAFEESSLGHIPKGWKAATVVQGFNLTMGQSPPGDTYNEEGNGLPFYQGRTDFGFRFPARRIYCTSPTRYARPGDTLISVRAPVGDINMANEECCIGRGVAAVRHKSGATSFTYHSLANLYPDFARFEAEGTVFGSINKDSFEKLRFVIPPDDIIAAYERQAGPLDEQIRTLENHSRTLASLRDTLLPKLLSGELRVSDAEKIVERTV